MFIDKAMTVIMNVAMTVTMTLKVTGATVIMTATMTATVTTTADSGRDIEWPKSSTSDTRGAREARIQSGKPGGSGIPRVRSKGSQNSVRKTEGHKNQQKRGNQRLGSQGVRKTSRVRRTREPETQKPRGSGKPKVTKTSRSQRVNEGTRYSEAKGSRKPAESGARKPG